MYICCLYELALVYARLCRKLASHAISQFIGGAAHLAPRQCWGHCFLRNSIETHHYTCNCSDDGYASFGEQVNAGWCSA